MKKETTKIKNNLSQARRRSGLSQKQVSFLLNRKATDEISRYEKGIYMPSLKTALRLSIIYRTPLHLLYQSLYKEYREEIAATKKNHPHLFPGDDPPPMLDSSEEMQGEEYCFYANLLQTRVPSDLELELVHRHTINLVNVSGNFSRTRSASIDN